MKKFACIITAVLLLFAFLFNSYAYEKTVSFETPSSSENSALKWAKKFGKSYIDAPSAPRFANNCLYFMSKNSLVMANRETGEIIKTVQMTDTPSFSYVPVCVANGLIFCPLDNGTIQAFDAETMKSVWIYHDSLGGQSLTPIVCSEGKIYTGFWNDEDQYANFVCIDVKDENVLSQTEEKKADWAYKSLGGFYRTECVIDGNYLFVGCDNGTLSSDGNSRALCIDKSSGKLYDYVNAQGDIRCGVTYKNSFLYFVTKGGYLYGVKFSNGKFDKQNIKKLSLGGASTSTPIIYADRLYVGVQGGNISSGYIKVIDKNSFNIIYSAETSGYPQGNFLLSDYYANDTGKIYIYFTCNCPPGGLFVLCDSVTNKTADVRPIYSPYDDSSGYCISPVECDEKGTLYFKNDSGYIFAVSKTNNSSEKSLFVRILEFLVFIYLFVKRIIWGGK